MNKKISRRKFICLSSIATTSVIPLYKILEHFGPNLFANDLGNESSTGIHNNNSKLQNLINEKIDELISNGYLSIEDKTSFVSHVINDNQRYVSIHSENLMQTASMIKTTAAVIYPHAGLHGNIEFDKEIKKNVHRIIKGLVNNKKKRGVLQPNASSNLLHYSHLNFYNTLDSVLESLLWESNNEIFNIVVDLCGGLSDTQELLDKNYGNIFTNTKIVEYIPTDKKNNGRTYKNKSTAEDHYNFLYALNQGGVFYCTPNIRTAMSIPKKDRIITDTYIPNKVSIVDKKGSTSQLIGDMGIVDVPTKNSRNLKYIFVGIVQNENNESNVYGKFKENAGYSIRRISEVVFDFYKKQYNLKLVV
jgi:beta-lactamase family protein